MLKILYNGRSGLSSNQNRLDAISNNIANVETNGYKRMDVAFEDIFYEQMDRLGLPTTGNTSNGFTVGSGARADITVRNFMQGLLLQTDRDGDLGIEGDGMFRLKDSNGAYFYTRDGSFTTDKNGNFVHSSGLILDIENYDSSKLSGDYSINENGEVISGDKVIGKIKLYDFADKDGLAAVGQNLFQGDNPKEAAGSKIKKGFIERSNVDIAQELTDMMITQRAYELNSRTIKSADEMWQIANNLRGK